MAKIKYTNRKRLRHSVFYFITTIVLIVALFPKEAKFKFEFYKGKPWMHKELIAPFSFAVKKTDEQIKHETDSLTRFARKVFVFDNTNFNSNKEELLSRYFNQEETKEARVFVDSLFQYFSTKYIIEPEQLELLKNDEILLVNGKKSEVLFIQSLYTPKKLYLEIQKVIKDYKSENEFSTVFSVFDRVGFENYIVANLDYNEKLSQKFLADMINQISPTQGLVQKGELIIGAGKVISKKDYEILQSYKIEYKKRHIGVGGFNTLLGLFLLVLIPFSMLFLYLLQFHKRILMTSRSLIFLLISSFVFIAFVTINHRYGLVSVYLVPVIIFPIMVRTFLNTQVAAFSYIIVILLISYLVPNSFKYFFIQYAAGLVGIYAFPKITKRSHLFNISMLTMVVYAFCYVGLDVLQEEQLANVHWDNVGLLAINSLLIMLTYPLVFLSEKLFGFTSDVTLLELSDTNHKLLKELSEKTPGTFQHSLQVANIAEELIRHIGGNPLLVRAGALYHDIGKLKNPEYFTENQHGGYNPHEQISPIESAKIIIKHVEDGVKIAKANNLPQVIIDFIPMHQGTTATKFFLNTYKKTHNDFDESLFHYPGPTPNTKETAVVMIADSLEAASRSLETYTKENIEVLVNAIVDMQLKERQFDNVHMTFKDIATIKRVLVDKIGTIYHSRVAYPKDMKKD